MATHAEDERSPGSDENVFNGCKNLLQYINEKEMRELWRLPPIVNVTVP